MACASFSSASACGYSIPPFSLASRRQRVAVTAIHAFSCRWLVRRSLLRQRIAGCVAVTTIQAYTRGMKARRGIRRQRVAVVTTIQAVLVVDGLFCVLLSSGVAIILIQAYTLGMIARRTFE